MGARPQEDELRALEEGRAALQTAAWTTVAVDGADAGAWLNDLVTAGVDGVVQGEAVRSLLLSPTGRIRAEFWVHASPEGLVLLQPPGQPAAVDELLAPYVLSSDVRLERRDLGLSLLQTRSGWAAGVPTEGHVQVGPVAYEVWRIRSGIPRFPVDVDEDSLPSEAGLERLIDFTKGCFLGQEAVAKVRNLGHPPRVVLAMRAGGAVAPGEPVLSRRAEAGVVTSATEMSGGSALLARLRWDARGGDLRTASGLELRPA